MIIDAFMLEPIDDIDEGDEKDEEEKETIIPTIILKKLNKIIDKINHRSDKKQFPKYFVYADNLEGLKTYLFSISDKNEYMKAKEKIENRIEILRLVKNELKDEKIINIIEDTIDVVEKSIEYIDQNKKFKQESNNDKKEKIDATDMPDSESEKDAAKIREKLGKGLKILTPQQMLSRLPISLAQLKAGNNSEKLKNETRQLLYSLYRSKKLSKKKIDEHLIKAI